MTQRPSKNKGKGDIRRKREAYWILQDIINSDILFLNIKPLNVTKLKLFTQKEKSRKGSYINDILMV